MSTFRRPFDTNAPTGTTCVVIVVQGQGKLLEMDRCIATAGPLPAAWTASSNSAIKYR